MNQKAPEAGFGSTGSSAGTPDGRTMIAGKPVQLRFDAPLLLVVIVLLVFGIMMVFSSSYYVSIRSNEGDPFAIVQRQFLIMLLGVAAMVIATFFDYHYFKRLAVPLMVFTLLTLIVVLLINRTGIYRRELFGDSVQPSELAKLVLIIYLAIWLFAKRERLHTFSFGLLPMAFILGVLGGLIAGQPDLSAVITLVFLGVLMFFLAGGDLKQLIVLGLVAMVAGFLVYQASATGPARVGGFLAGLKNPFSAPDQVQRSIESFINGGWFGVGIGKGEMKVTGLQFPHTDSVFAVVGEEMGMVGVIFLLSLYAVLIWRGMKIARQAPDELGALLAAGLTLWIGFEAFANMSSVVNLIPFAGNALPFISVGGSNLLVTLAAIGILLNISRFSVKTRETNGRLFSAVVDLRGRNWRRRVPRSNRSSGADSQAG